MENIKRQLETTNDDLENKARALEAEVVVLREKNDHLLEEKVLVSHELEGQLVVRVGRQLLFYRWKYVMCVLCVFGVMPWQIYE